MSETISAPRPGGNGRADTAAHLLEKETYALSVGHAQYRDYRRSGGAAP